MVQFFKHLRDIDPVQHSIPVELFHLHTFLFSAVLEDCLGLEVGSFHLVVFSASSKAAWRPGWKQPPTDCEKI